MRKNGDEDIGIPVIPISAGSLIHTSERPFCYNDTCGCHEDLELIAEITAAVNQGLLTPEEATLVVRGKTI